MELTENEKTILNIFTSDAGAFQVVYKVAKNQIIKAKSAFIRGLSSQKDKTNEQIGAQIRAFDEASLMVDTVFRELRQFKEEPAPDTRNRAR